MATTGQNSFQLCAKCQLPAGSACKGCLLVLYCGRKCQTEHWEEHKKICKSALMESTWQPGWVHENRIPTFIGGSSFHSFGGNKFLWGNMPAFDVLRLSNNEGNDYKEQLNVLFAASGDLRNLMKSIASIPATRTAPIQCTLNDRDLDVVARNAIMLLLTLNTKDTARAVSCVIHIWYSALLRQTDMDLLNESVRPLIADVVQKISAKPAGTMLGKTWKFGQNSFRIEMTKDQWQYVLSCLQIPANLTAKEAHARRMAVTLAEERKDYRDRRMIPLSPPHRVSMHRFREDGILAPFGLFRDDFIIPNPTIFQSPEWPLKDRADPLDGWNLREILSIDIGLAKNDIYGKLSKHLETLWLCFHDRLATVPCHFALTNVNAEELPPRLEKDSFARIEVSNISDLQYLGIARTMHYLSPLLQKPSQNPHATLITLFMNAVHDIADRLPDMKTKKRELEQAVKYFRFTSLPTSPYDPQNILLGFSNSQVRDMDNYFNKYIELHDFKSVEKSFGVKIQNRHSIIDKWPLRLKLKADQEGAYEEFHELLASNFDGCERYMEWRRVV